MWIRTQSRQCLVKVDTEAEALWQNQKAIANMDDVLQCGEAEVPNDKLIIFSTEMVRAILEGHKPRRVIKPQPNVVGKEKCV